MPVQGEIVEWLTLGVFQRFVREWNMKDTYQGVIGLEGSI
jgi:hypothetical protein